MKIKISIMRAFLIFVGLIGFVASNQYEIILEGIEGAFEDDQVLSFETFRIKKFNRTT